MMEFLKLQCLLSVLLFYTHLVTILGECEDPRQVFFIRSVPAGFVLEAQNSTVVQIHPFTGFTQQQWHFERSTKAGGFYVIDESKQWALDVSSNTTVIISLFDSNSEQQLWYINHDGTIENGDYNGWNMDLYLDNHDEGTPVVVYKKSGLSQQIFTFQEKS